MYLFYFFSVLLWAMMMKDTIRHHCGSCNAFSTCGWARQGMAEHMQLLLNFSCLCGQGACYYRSCFVVC